MEKTKKTVIVTGCAGMTGGVLVEELLDAGYAVVGADVQPEDGHDEPEWTYRRCDISDPAQVDALFEASAPVHAVFHAAAIVPYNLAWSGSEERLRDVNVRGTGYIVDSARRAGVKSLVFASSSGVAFAGTHDVDQAEEEDAVAGAKLNDAYSQSKADAERIVLDASDPAGLACVAIRPNGIWGPGEAHHTPKALLAAQLGGTGMAMGARGQTDFTHVRNLAHAFRLALLAMEGRSHTCSRAGVAGQAFFVTDGWRVTTMGLFSPLMAALGFTAPLSHSVVHSETGRRIPRFFDDDRELTADEEEHAVVRMEEPWLGVPHPLLVLGAHLMTGTSALVWLLTAGTVRLEPFLTPADCRKLWFHNNFSSDKARRFLGWKPVITPALGLREMVAHLRTEGYDGRVPMPGPLPAAAVLLGLGLLAVLAADVGGALTAVLGALPWLPAGGELTLAGATCRVTASSTLWALLAAAVMTHAAEAVFAATAAASFGFFVPGWAAMVVVFGFPAVQTMLQQARAPMPWWVPAGCAAAFASCVILAAPVALLQCHA